MGLPISQLPLESEVVPEFLLYLLLTKVTLKLSRAWKHPLRCAPQQERIIYQLQNSVSSHADLDRLQLPGVVDSRITRLWVF